MKAKPKWLPTKRTRCGATLLETVVALSLCGLLMVCISGVLRHLMLQQRAVVQGNLNQWQYALDRLLWNDLAQSLAVSFSEGKLLMVQQDGTSIQYGIEHQTAPRPSTLKRSIFAGEKPKSTGNGLSFNRNRLVLRSTQTVLWNANSIHFSRIDSSGSEQPIPNSLSPSPGSLKYTIDLNTERLERTITVR